MTIANVERHRGIWLATYGLLTVIVGACTAIFWANVTGLPTFRVNADYSASITESSLSQWVLADAWFVGCGALVGIGLGIVAWRWFGYFGVTVTFIGLVGATISALVCWWLGQIIGSPGFADRLTQASQGESVPINLDVHAPGAFLVWPLAAMLPIIVGAAFSRHHQRHHPSAE
ncbi:MAG: hypothetical protein LBR20_02030 [Propionibacteriaceae bacterium]|jgi:hypothetical protein|nr:hypothetical protein [Propionibacteriaceae bacterium]